MITMTMKMMLVIMMLMIIWHSEAAPRHWPTYPGTGAPSPLQWSWTRWWCRWRWRGWWWRTLFCKGPWLRLNPIQFRFKFKLNLSLSYLAQPNPPIKVELLRKRWKGAVYEAKPGQFLIFSLSKTSLLENRKYLRANLKFGQSSVWHWYWYEQCLRLMIKWHAIKLVYDETIYEKSWSKSMLTINREETK